MKTITVYTPDELKAVNPDGFDKAFSRWNSGMDEIPWSNEIIESLKGVFQYAGIGLRDYSIDADCGRSYVKFGMDDDVAYLTGQRAVAWLENNLLAQLRVKYGLANIKNRVKYGEKAGSIKTCPFTGYCADDEFIASLINSVVHGESIGEAFHGLADDASKMIENELEYAQSEECFLMQDFLQFTEEGALI